MNLGAHKSDEPLNDIFSAYNSALLGSIAATAVTLPIDTEHIVSGATYILASNELTVSVAGNYEIVYSATLRIASGSSRSQARAWLERNSVTIAGTETWQYCRLTNNGATGSAQIYFPLQVDDVIRVRAQRIAGGNLLEAPAGGSRLTLRRI